MFHVLFQEVGAGFWNIGRSSSGVTEKVSRQDGKAVVPQVVPKVVSKRFVEHVEDHTCDEYKLPIWEKAFSNPIAMGLLDESLITLREAATDEVCSNTIRSILYFGQTTLVNDDAHYCVGMFFKLCNLFVKELDIESENYKVTMDVLRTMFVDDDARDLTLNTIVRLLEVLKDAETRARMWRVVLAVKLMIQPSEQEKMAKESMKNMAKYFKFKPTSK